MTITIRQLESSNEIIDALMHIRLYSFTSSPPIPEITGEEREDWLHRAEESRHYAVYEGGVPLATAATLPMTQNVRGKLYPMTGLWGVCTLPQGRRKGYVRDLLRYMVEQERDFVFGGLYPFRESFYERMGYVRFPLLKEVTFDPVLLAPLLKWDIPGEIEFTDSSKGFDLWRDYLRKQRNHTHGMAITDVPGPDRALKHDAVHWLAFAVIDGQRCGAMLYRIIEENDDHVFNVPFFYIDDATARYRLLQWAARHIDQVEKVRFRLPPYERPEAWVPDLYGMGCRFRDPGMGRVLDISRLDGMQVGEGGFSARITDDLAPWNAGVYRFESVDGLLHVEQASNPDFELTIQGLSALVLGTHPADSFAVKGWGNPTPEAEVLFPPAQPFMHTRY